MLTEVFTEDYREQVPLVSGDEATSREIRESAYTKEAEEEIKERLRGLGYLG